jgi:hypothetical protein
VIADISATLGHPLLLLLVGAAVSSYLIPALTRQWQDHQKELEVKIDLVDEISKTVAEFVIAVQFAQFRSDNQSQEQYDDAYRAWEIARPTIGSRLRAYFPGSTLVREWEELAQRVSDLYATTGAKEAERSRQLRRIAHIKDDNARSVLELWRGAKISLLNETDELGGRILEDKIPQFNHSVLRSTRRH